MGRYDKYQEAVREERAFQEEQERLHEKHSIEDEDTVVIETTNMTKFLLTYLRLFLRSAFGIILITLGTVGILTLLYPDSRAEFFAVLTQIAENIRQLI